MAGSLSDVYCDPLTEEAREAYEAFVSIGNQSRCTNFLAVDDTPLEVQQFWASAPI